MSMQEGTEWIEVDETPEATKEARMWRREPKSTNPCSQCAQVLLTFEDDVPDKHPYCACEFTSEMATLDFAERIWGSPSSQEWREAVGPVGAGTSRTYPLPGGGEATINNDDGATRANAYFVWRVTMTPIQDVYIPQEDVQGSVPTLVWGGARKEVEFVTLATDSFFEDTPILPDE